MSFVVYPLFCILYLNCTWVFRKWMKMDVYKWIYRVFESGVRGSSAYRDSKETFKSADDSPSILQCL